MPVEPQATLLDRLRESDLLEAGPLEELSRLPEAQDPDPRALVVHAVGPALDWVLSWA